MRRMSRKVARHRRRLAKKHASRPSWMATLALAAATSAAVALPIASPAGAADRASSSEPPAIGRPAGPEEGSTGKDAAPADGDPELPPVTDTIEVTAPARPESIKYTAPLRETPQTITLVPRELIAEQGATTLRDVLRNVTGISLQAGEGGGGLPGDNLAIRGFAARNDIFVDGVRDFGAYSRDPYNLDQVEVAKGPASTIAGRGSTGGVINLITKAPILASARSAALSLGTDRFERATLDVNHPVGLADSSTEGEAFRDSALRVNAVWSRGDTPGRDEVENSRWGVSPSLAIGLGGETRGRLSYSYLSQDNLPEYGIPWVPATNRPLAAFADRPAPVSFGNFYGLIDRDHEDLSTSIATAVVERNLGSSAMLKSVVRNGEAKRDSVITAPRFASDQTTDLNRQLQSRLLDDGILAHQTDLVLETRTGAVEHSIATGVEISRETSRNRLRTGPTAPLADLYDPNPHQAYAGPVVLTGARTESEADTAAAYLFDTVSLGAEWKLSAGLRWDRFAVDFENVAADGTALAFERIDSQVSWRAAVVRGWGARGSAYFGAGTSFNPSADGATGLSLTAATVDLEPETSRTFELGTKWDFFDSRLSANAAVFRSEKTNARTPGLPGDPPTVLDGEQRVDGLEVGLTGRLTRRWSVFAGYSHMESEVVRSNTPAEVGKRLANTPEDSWSLWSSYRFRSGWEVGGGGSYVGARFSNNTNNRRAPAYLTLDATVSYTVNDHLSLRLNGSNLADERYIDRVGGGHFIPGPGRSLALTTQISF